MIVLMILVANLVELIEINSLVFPSLEDWHFFFLYKLRNLHGVRSSMVYGM